jgi:membrane protein DedA with SNARE-associated domain
VTKLWSTVSSSLESESTSNRAGGPGRYWHYVFVVSLLTIVICLLALINGYFHLYDVSSYSLKSQGVSTPYVLAGYLGMFLTLAISPVPDYILVPVYGYLSSIGLFNPEATFFICLLGALFPIEYVCGYLVARPLLLKAFSYIRITEKDLKKAERWLVEHGKFSIFMATFIPFFYSAAALAAGTLKMDPVTFILASTVGFGLRYIFLEYIGYYGIYIFAASFDYSQRSAFFFLLLLASAYALIYLARTGWKFQAMFHRKSFL